MLTSYSHAIFLFSEANENYPSVKEHPDYEKCWKGSVIVFDTERRNTLVSYINKAVRMGKDFSDQGFTAPCATFCIIFRSVLIFQGFFDVRLHIFSSAGENFEVSNLVVSVDFSRMQTLFHRDVLHISSSNRDLNAAIYDRLKECKWMDESCT